MPGSNGGSAKVNYDPWKMISTASDASVSQEETNIQLQAQSNNGPHGSSLMTPASTLTMNTSKTIFTPQIINTSIDEERWYGKAKHQRTTSMGSYGSTMSISSVKSEHSLSSHLTEASTSSSSVEESTPPMVCLPWMSYNAPSINPPSGIETLPISVSGGGDDVVYEESLQFSSYQSMVQSMKIKDISRKNSGTAAGSCISQTTISPNSDTGGSHSLLRNPVRLEEVIPSVRTPTSTASTSSAMTGVKVKEEPGLIANPYQYHLQELSSIIAENAKKRRKAESSRHIPVEVEYEGSVNTTVGGNGTTSSGTLPPQAMYYQQPLPIMQTQPNVYMPAYPQQPGTYAYPLPVPPRYTPPQYGHPHMPGSNTNSGSSLQFSYQMNPSQEFQQPQYSNAIHNPTTLYHSQHFPPGIPQQYYFSYHHHGTSPVPYAIPPASLGPTGFPSFPVDPRVYSTFSPVLQQPPPQVYVKSEPIKITDDQPVFSEALFTINEDEMKELDAQLLNNRTPGPSSSPPQTCVSSSTATLAPSTVEGHEDEKKDGTEENESYSHDNESITTTGTHYLSAKERRDRLVQAERIHPEDREARFDYMNEQRVLQHLAPRIYKSDMRRQYPRMFANILNSFDIGLMTSFHHQLATPNVAMNMSCTSPYFSFALNVQKRDLLTTYWSGLMQLAPDHTFEISNVQLITQYGSLKCRLTFDFEVKGSQLYAIQPDEMVRDMTQDFHDMKMKGKSKEKGKAEGEKRLISEREVERVVNSEEMKRFTHQDAITREVGHSVLPYHFDPIESYRRRRNGQMPGLRPIYLDIKGKYVIHVNEQKLIEKIDVDGHMHIPGPPSGARGPPHLSSHSTIH